MSKIIYYYQTFRGLDDILIEKTPVTHIHIASVHFGYDENKPYIHLNDHSPYNERFDGVWGQIRKANELGIKIVLMLGGQLVDIVCSIIIQFFIIYFITFKK